ncbi:WD repeat-containing protein 5B-like [Ptychodera flava]|uniref:WD repeat-containing protein 5B-like n=1 Tax=Ptychodera flava TaxID=63121 RepID=UPI00396A8EC0
MFALERTSISSLSGSIHSNMSTTVTPRTSRKTSGAGDAFAHRIEPSVDGNLKLAHVIECSGDVMCCRYNEDSKLLAVGLANGVIKVYSADNGALLYNISDQETLDTSLPCTSIHFRPHQDADKSKNIILATYASGLVKYWHTATGKCLSTIHEPRQTLNAAFNNRINTFITSGSDDSIYVYDETTKKLLQTCEPSPSLNVMDGHRSRVFAVQFHPKELHEFISGGWDDTVQYWDTRVQHSIRKLYGPHICGDSLDIDADHNHILTGSWRKTDNLQIWDYSSGGFIKSVPQDFTSSLLYCAQWLGKDYMAVGGCEQNIARVIDRGTLQTTGRIVDLPGGVYCIANDHRGIHPRIAVGSGTNIYVLDKKPIPVT